LGVTTNRTDGQLVSWEWSNLNDSLACLNCPDPRVSPLGSFIAEVTVTDSNGCEVTLRQNVIVEERDLIYMPSAFSPNGDGVNDVYTVFGNAEFVDGVNFLRIFDRWGNLVFSNENFRVNDPDSGWTGVGPNGQISPSAVYVYSVSYNRWDGETTTLRGDMTLVK
jgi:gliding motility-associated-like protein